MPMTIDELCYDLGQVYNVLPCVVQRVREAMEAIDQAQRAANGRYRDAQDECDRLVTTLHEAEAERDEARASAQAWHDKYAIYADGENADRIEAIIAERNDFMGKLNEARETIKRLNYKLQRQQAGFADLDRVRKANCSKGGNFGRALANWAAETYHDERDAAVAHLREVLQAIHAPYSATHGPDQVDQPIDAALAWLGAFDARQVQNDKETTNDHPA